MTESNMDIDLDLDVELEKELLAPNAFITDDIDTQLEAELLGEPSELPSSQPQQGQFETQVPTITTTTTTTTTSASEEAAQQQPDTDSIQKEDSPYDQFEALPRPTAIFLHGVDNLSTDDIKGYVNSPLLSKLEWINDSSCNLVCNTPEEATEIAQSLLEDGSQIQTLDHRTLLPAKPFIVENSKDNQPSRVETLSIRMATDEDIKERGARLRSRYYMIHGVDGQELSKERQEARKLHVDRMKRNGGDGRDVFSRLGKKVERATGNNDYRRTHQNQRSRSRSPTRQSSRAVQSRHPYDPSKVSSKSNNSEKEVRIPDSLLSRLGPLKKKEHDVTKD